MSQKPLVPPDWLIEEAILFLLDDLPMDQEARFAQTLESGDELHLVALEIAGEVVGKLDSAVGDARMSETLRQKMAAMIHSVTAPVKKAAAAQAGFLWIDQAAQGWQDTHMPGVQQRKLFTDPNSGLLTYLLKMAPGSKLDAHHHQEAEQCWVLEGEVGNKWMTVKTGDFFVAQKGTVHNELRSKNGCVLLIIGPPEIEFGVHT
jgi:quercetin dioxygenase-like cupin family protein